jgi:gas vesicle protein
MSKKSVLKSGILGVLIGAVSGILFAPKSGKETRQDIKDAAAKANKEAEKQLKELHTELLEKSEQLKEVATNLKGKAKTEAEELGEKAEVLRGRVSKLIAAVRDFEADDAEVVEVKTDGKDVLKKISSKLKK